MKSAPGRPKRPIFAREQTRVWARSVKRELQRNGALPYSYLKEDGRVDLWSRYLQGLTTPSEERVARIEERLPGTARYFNATVWALFENRTYGIDELRDSLGMMSSNLAQGIRPMKPLSNGATDLFWRRPWRDKGDSSELDSVKNIRPAQQGEEIGEYVRHVGHPQFGLDMLGAYLFLIRESEVHQSASKYLQCLEALPQVRKLSSKNELFADIGKGFWIHLIRPLSEIHFADAEVQESWQYRLSSTPINSEGALMRTFEALWSFGGRDSEDERFMEECKLCISLFHDEDK